MYLETAYPQGIILIIEYSRVVNVIYSLPLPKHIQFIQFYISGGVALFLRNFS